MTPLEKSIRRAQGYGDIVRGDPKPAKGAHWNRGIRVARLYANQWCREWSKGVYLRCVTCGGPAEEWAHVLSGKGDAVRWEKQNICRQCARCNLIHEMDPEPLVTWFLKTYGQPALFELTVKSNRPVKMTYSQIMTIGDEYRKLTRTRLGEGVDQ